MRVVIDAQDRAVFQPDAGRALDLREQHVDLIVQIADFQMPAVERAILDLAAIVVGHDLAAADAAADENAFARKRVAELAPAGGDEIGRPAIKRRGKFAGRHARAGDDRLVIAGEKTVGIAELVDANRPEIILEEFFRAGLVERNGLARAFANLLQRGRNRGQFAAAMLLGFKRAAARQEGRESRGVIVADPAVDIRPVDGLVLRVRKFDRLRRLFYRLFAAGGHRKPKADPPAK